MRKTTVPLTVDLPDQSSLGALSRLAKVASEISVRDLQTTIELLQAQLLRYETAVDKVSQGICSFDGQQRLILSNRRYAEIYKLEPDNVVAGTTLRAITERRYEVGTCPMAVDEYLAWCASVNSGTGPQTRTLELKDGRTIHICHQPMPDGGWVATHEDITELKAKRRSADELFSLQTLIDIVPDYLWVKDPDSKFVVVNRSLASDVGHAHSSEMIGLNDFDFHSPASASEFQALEQEILRTGVPMIDKEEFVVNSRGVQKWLLSTKVPLRNSTDEIIGVVGIARDITERKKADILRDGQAEILEKIASNVALEDVLNQLVLLVESQLVGINCSILLLAGDGKQLKHGAAPHLPQEYIKAIDGVRIGPEVGSCGTAAFKKKAVIVTDIAGDPLWDKYRDVAAKHGLRSCWSTPIISHDGTVLGTFAMYSRAVREPNDAEKNLVAVSTRMAGIAIGRKQAEDRIQFMANHDALTGLPNRTLLQDRLSQALSEAKRFKSWVTVIFLDLDNFKTVNDSLGHNAGDELLRIVAKRMTASLRSTDTVVRLGGDEFVILLPNLPKNPDLISRILETLRAALAETITLAGHDVNVTSSMGIANYPDDGADVEMLLANADKAMYRAKGLGRDNFQFHTPKINTEGHE